MTELTRIMALDVGHVRIGVAISDALKITAQPHSYIENTDEQSVIDKLQSLIQSESVSQVVVGMPKRLDGSKGETAEAAKSLGMTIRQSCNIKVTFWDERYSTHAAERTLLEGNVRRAKRKQIIDQTAAAWILQGFLDAQALR